MKKVLTISLAMLALVACSKDRNNDPVSNIREAVKDKDLQEKVFVSECAEKPIDALLTGLFSGGKSSIKAIRTAYFFAGANVTRTTRLFNSLDCSGDAAFTFEELGDIKIDKDQKTNDGGFFIDMDFHSLKVKMATDAGATAANAVKLCKVSDWAAKQERDVTGASADVNCYNAQVPRHNANVYRVDANTLYFGTQAKSTNDGSTRPTKVDTSVKYVR